MGTGRNGRSARFAKLQPEGKRFAQWELSKSCLVLNRKNPGSIGILKTDNPNSQYYVVGEPSGNFKLEYFHPTSSGAFVQGPTFRLPLRDGHFEQSLQKVISYSRETKSPLFSYIRGSARAAQL